MRNVTDGGTMLDSIRSVAQPLSGAMSDYDGIVDMVGDARFVLIGEASHGTHEFYRVRAEITQRLIAEKGFSAVIVEADWPDAYRVNCFVRGASNDRSPEQALSDFQRFPAWMWRNTVVRDFVTWLREHNAGRPDETAKVGFYGMDLYSLSTSIERVIGYLNSIDPEAAQRARDRYSCFEFTSRDAEAYGYAASFGTGEPCEDEVVQQLLDMQRRYADVTRSDGSMAEDEAFAAEQNARLVKNAEEYYRSMFRGRVSSWNLRDRHMVETIVALTEHLSRQGQPAKLVVWAHNSHLGDARATEMGTGGEWNVGQRVRERYGDASVLIGFATHTGTVTAATDWGDDAETKPVSPSLPNSYERLLHDTGVPSFWLNLRDDPTMVSIFREPKLERAIGVIYRPQTERVSHYFQATLSEQFDAIIHIDETRAVEPLERHAPLPDGALPDTYPFGDDVPTADTPG